MKRQLKTDNREPKADNRKPTTESRNRFSVLGSLFSVFGFRFSVLCFLFSVLSSLFSSPSHSSEPIPAPLQNVSLQQKLGTTIPLNLLFKDEAGKQVSLQNYFSGQKPVLLALVYYECPNLCTYLLNGTTEALQKMAWNVGEQFELVAVSIDPRETPALALPKKKAYLEKYGRPATEKGWHFLVGQEKNIRGLASAVGFQYRYDEEEEQYAHPAALFVLTPKGKLARVLSGIQFEPRDLKLALLEASEGKIGNAIDQLLLFCYRYDPKASRYVLFADRIMKVGGILTILLLSYFVFRLGRSKPKT